MFTSVAIGHLGYFREKAYKAKMAAAKMDAEGKLDHRQFRYFDNEDAPGVAFSQQVKEPSDLPVQPLFENGQHVSFDVMEDMAKGRHPLTGDYFVKISPITGEPVHANRRPGFDNMTAPPKDVSALWALAMTELKRNPNDKYSLELVQGIEAALFEANDAMLQHAFDNGWIVGRRSKPVIDPVTGEHKHDPETGELLMEYGYEAAVDAPIIKFFHRTSRDGDPQLHIHNVWINMVVYKDGHITAGDNIELKRYGGALAANFRGNMVDKLKEKIGHLVPGMDFEKIRKAWGIVGFESELKDGWSKRTNTIAEIAEVLGYDKSKDREATVNINRNTRLDKDELPPFDELVDQWAKEATDLGMDLHSVIDKMTKAKAARDEELDKAWAIAREDAARFGIEFAEKRPLEPQEEDVIEQAFSQLIENEVAFSEREMRKHIYEAVQVYGGTPIQTRIYDKIAADEKLIALGKKGPDSFFSTQDIIDREWKMLAKVGMMATTAPALRRSMVERIIAEGKTVQVKEKQEDGSFLTVEKTLHLTKKQADAVRYAAGEGQIKVIEGRAGAGKSFTMGALVKALGEDGYEVFGTAVAWKAVKVLCDDTGIEFGGDKRGMAIHGLLEKWKAGKLDIGPKSAIVVDEAGMLSNRQMEDLVELARQTKCRVILTGDTRQLEAVQAGAPFRAISSIYGSFVLDEIIRQNHQWARKAAVQLSMRQTSDALREFNDRGFVHFVNGRDEVVYRAVSDMLKKMDSNPGESCYLIAQTNAEVRKINQSVRKALIEKGALGEFEYKLDVLAKDGETITKLGVRAGERMQLGENLTIDQEKLFNGQTFTVKDIIPADKKKGTEDAFVVRFDHMQRDMVIKVSELVGFREEPSEKNKRPTPKVPQVNWAWSGTNHSAQGSTFLHTFLLASDGWTWRQAYVAATRFKESCNIYVERERLIDKLASAGGVEMKFSRGGKVVAKENPADSDKIVTDEMILEDWLRESQKEDAKKNISDFVDAPKEVIEAYKEIVLYEERVREFEMMEESQKNTLPRRQPPTRPTGPFANGWKPKIEDKAISNAVSNRPINASENPAEALRQQAAKSGYEFKAKDKSKKYPESLGRVAQNELDHFVKQNLAEYMLSNGGSYDKESQQGRKFNHEKWGAGTEYTVRFAKGVKYVVTQWARKDNWTWFLRGSNNTKGNIINFVEHFQGKSNGDAKQFLRDHFRTTPDKDLTNSNSTYKPEPVVAIPLKQRLEQAVPKIEDFDLKKVGKQEKRWEKGRDVGNGVFSQDLSNRAINEETQVRLGRLEVLKLENPETQSDWSVEGEGPSRKIVPIDNRNPDGFMFALRYEGLVAGVIRKGPVGRFEGKRLNETSADTQRVLLTYGYTDNPKFIAFAESSTDSVTDFQEQNYREDTLWVATAGNPKETELAMIYDLARKYPDADWRFIGQNDDQNVKFEADVREAVETGNPKAKFEVERPDPQFKDVNEALQARVKAERGEQRSEQAEQKTGFRRPRSMEEWANQLAREPGSKISSKELEQARAKQREDEEKLTQGPRRGR
ncbi:hypothetical protein ELG63_36435 [Rhizobium leguminosarum]|uniref:AAA family ATPase n=1 Tax=Rhizobium leguminosarum TaxID=384 RepID=UPI001030BBBE|nr:AAA family ATPase [Rhizobium leguminosarum]TBH28178.1 hypothetical protein ELG63_36435 [Rhizobium leguminosarum]